MIGSVLNLYHRVYNCDIISLRLPDYVPLPVFHPHSFVLIHLLDDCSFAILVHVLLIVGPYLVESRCYLLASKHALVEGLHLCRSNRLRCWASIHYSRRSSKIFRVCVQ